jgi:plasmid stabilization system protein ParE
MTYRVHPEAGQDLDAIWEFIARDSSEAASRWISRILDTLDAIGRSPGIGHRRRDLTPRDVWFFPLERYLILYQITREVVHVVALTQGSRDIRELLKRRLGPGR